MDNPPPHPLWTAIEERLGCPINWRAIVGDLNSLSILRTLEVSWLLCFKEKAVDIPEVDFLKGMIFGEDWRFDAIRGDEAAVLKNINSVRDAAAAIYQRQFGRLARIEFQAPPIGIKSKHYVPNLTRGQTIQRSRQGPSLFFDNPQNTGLSNLFWNWFSNSMRIDAGSSVLDDASRTHLVMLCENASGTAATIWESFSQPKANIRVMAQVVGNPLGASRGHEADGLVFDIGLNVNQCILHAYPATLRQEKDVPLLGRVKSLMTAG